MPKKLFVGNLPFSSTEESIRNLFSQYGEVVSVKIPTDQMTGRPRGFAFVEMENADTAIAELNNYSFEGRNIKVDVAQERPRTGGGGGFNRGGGRGGRDSGGRRNNW